jgi:glycosyltransferase involved in cell wall biosynthesis
LRQFPDLQVDLISGPTTGPEGSLQDRVASIPGLLKIVPELVRPVNPGLDWRAFNQLRRLFEIERPDIVHTHSGKAGILGRLAAHRAGVKTIVHTIHGPSFGPFQGPVANFVFRAAERRAATVTTHFVTVADAMTRQYLAAGIGQPSQYTRILSGFDLDPFLQAKNDPVLRQRFGLAPDDVVIGKIARLFALKGHDDLLAVAPGLVKRFPKLKFLLVGDGNWRARFETQVRNLGLQQHVLFAGLVPPTQVPALIGIMDALVHLSRREGLPRALPQALAAAKPIIAYDCDGAGEVCIDGQTGFLIAPGDLDVLSRRILQIAEDQQLRRRLGEHGQTLVRTLFPVEKMVQDLYQLYQRLPSR